MISPDTQLDYIERSHLVAVVAQDGFKVIQKIMEIECEKFRLALDNAVEAKDIIKLHSLRQAAVMFYSGVVNRINSELEIQKHSPRKSDEPEDPTAELLGDVEELAAQLPNMEELHGY